MSRAVPGAGVGPAALLLAAVALGSCSPRDGRGGPPPRFDPGPTPSELAEGERLFGEHCARCHGALAVGTDQGPPLVHAYYVPSHHADPAFQRAVALGVPQHHWRFGDMPPVPGLGTEQVGRITAYVRWLQRRAGIY